LDDGFYGKAGWYANIALAVNYCSFGILASLGAVLYIGIAGIVLTMDTAVDANIIYERAKEELRWKIIR
jgi:SecD/SecF fusion protein